MKAIYTIELKPYDGGYLVNVPDVPGCTTGGKTLAEAMHMAEDALCGCLVVYEDEGVELPPARLPMDVPVTDGAYHALIEVDTTAYRASTDNRAVRRNVSLPAWLNTLADQHNVNVSQVLQDALKAQLCR